MISSLKEKISNLDANILYLIDEINDKAGFFTINKKYIYIIKNFEEIKYESIETEYLKLETNIYIKSIENKPSFENGYYNMITYKGDFNDDNFKSFVNLCTMHALNFHELKFKEFFYSLISLMQYPREQNYKNLIGLYGELKFIEYIYKNTNIDISGKWHKNGSLDKYDFTFSNSNIEVKTTLSEDFCINIKHDQLFNNDTNYLVYVIIEKNLRGETINELINRMQDEKLYCNNINFSINVERERKRISPIEAKKEKLRVKSINIYDANTINPIPNLPCEISNLKYKLNLIEYSCISIDNIREKIEDVQDK